MRAPSALHHDPAGGVAIEHDAGTEKVATNHVAGRNFARQTERIPALMKVGRDLAGGLAD
jgi:hypothetical protein